MNNNRNNNNNRRRGRGNNRNQGGGNQMNRIDSRARGNAPQLLDKYKKLAQDAHHNGDRVQMEYYLQFADHYFRVIADNRARQDEGRTRRPDERGEGDFDRNDNDFDRDDDFDRIGGQRARGPRDEQSDDRPARGGNGRGRRDEYESGEAGEYGSDDDSERDEGDNPFMRDERPREARPRDERPRDDRARAAPRRGRNPRPPRDRDDGDGEEIGRGAIDVAALPPAIASDGDAPLRAPPRRRRKVAEDGEAVEAAE